VARPTPSSPVHYALGEELHLALFEKSPSQRSTGEGGLDVSEAERITSVSFIFNPSDFTYSTIVVSWPSLSPDSPGTTVTQILADPID